MPLSYKNFQRATLYFDLFQMDVLQYNFNKSMTAILINTKRISYHIFDLKNFEEYASRKNCFLKEL